MTGEEWETLRSLADVIKQADKKDSLGIRELPKNVRKQFQCKSS